MRQRSFIVVAVAVAVLIFGTVGVYAYDKTRDDVIANGVSAGGVDLSGLRPAEARKLLESQLSTPLQQPVFVKHGDDRYRLSAKRAKVQVDVDGMVAEALDRSREGNLLSRTARALTGGDVDETIPVSIDYDRAAVSRLASRVKDGVDRPAQDATIDFAGGSVERVKAHTGISVNKARLVRRIKKELVEPTADHRVSVPTEVTRPEVTTRELAEKYPTVIAVNRGGHQLTLYKNLKVVKNYPIAVGQAGLETPAGKYNIQNKQVDPSWHVPESDWAGSLAGQVIPPGPQNPLKARWMGIYAGAGIHGTSDVGSLGTNASHGCIRMAVPDVIDLYDRVNVGDPVFIA
jgi:lipoprotein-anchoring transpeptidase ErfK/SrfK